MPTTVTYPVSLPYRHVPSMAGMVPAAEVTLYYGGFSANTVAIFDSGSPYTVFSPEHAQIIGIEDVREGTLERINTLGGGAEIYLFDLEIQLAGRRFGGQVGFFAARAPRNILGRSVIFAAFEIGFHESSQILHLRPE